MIRGPCTPSLRVQIAPFEGWIEIRPGSHTGPRLFLRPSSLGDPHGQLKRTWRSPNWQMGSNLNLKLLLKTNQMTSSQYLQQYLNTCVKIGEWHDFPNAFFVINTTVNHQVKLWCQRHCFQALPTHVAKHTMELVCKRNWNSQFTKRFAQLWMSTLNILSHNSILCHLKWSFKQRLLYCALFWVILGVPATPVWWTNYLRLRPLELKAILWNSKWVAVDPSKALNGCFQK